ncbi:MAG: hypothetical protein JRJ84_11065, partial [Deltaproteobacteria bacterium]|nr:hypothetical protein [Deltaproteobacteria bacterium]
MTNSIGSTLLSTALAGLMAGAVVACSSAHGGDSQSSEAEVAAKNGCAGPGGCGATHSDSSTEAKAKSSCSA